MEGTGDSCGPRVRTTLSSSSLPLADRWEERRRRFAARRALRGLLERSSLAEHRLWVECPSHGRQARDPFTEKCVMCHG